MEYRHHREDGVAKNLYAILSAFNITPFRIAFDQIHIEWDVEVRNKSGMVWLLCSFQNHRSAGTILYP